MSPRPALARSAALGLVAGVLLGAVYLLVRAVGLTRFECPPTMLSEECFLETSTASELSQLFLLSAFGLTLVGAGVFLVFRTKKDPA